jgi:hypothetical protein
MKTCTLAPRHFANATQNNATQNKQHCLTTLVTILNVVMQSVVMISVVRLSVVRRCTAEGL